jgi:hypothetical protein
MNFTNKTFKPGEYEAFKQMALTKSIIRKIVSLAQLEFVDKQTIKFNGQVLPMTDNGFKEFIKILGLSQGQNKNIEGLLGEKYQQQLITVMRSALATNDDKHKVVMLLDPDYKVVGFNKSNQVILSNEGYLQVFEDVMNANPSMEIKNMAITDGGNLEISTINHNWQFDVARLKNEYFKSGLVFLNTPNAMVVNPFTERLTCTNGSTISEKGLSIILNSTEESHFKGFFDKLRSIQNISHVEDVFKSRVAKMMFASASMAEVYKVRRIVDEHVSNSDFDRDARVAVEHLIPTKWLEEQFKLEKYDITQMDHKAHQKIRSNLSVWDLVNRLTEVASNPAKHGVFLKHGTNSVFAMQREAGELMFKKQYDFEEPIKQIFQAPNMSESED